ncbi:MAG: hypothetical protein ACRDNS_02160 [Trebonia sp.]
MDSETTAAISQIAGGEPVEEAALIAKVRAGRERSLARSTTELEIPGYDGTLWGTFRALDDYKRTRRSGKRFERVRDEDEREINVHAQTLLDSCVDCFIPRDGFQPDSPKPGDRLSLGPLGAALARRLGLLPDGTAMPVDDHDAVFLIYPNTLLVGAAAIVVNQFSARTGARVDEEEIEGNS